MMMMMITFYLLNEPYIHFIHSIKIGSCVLHILELLWYHLYSYQSVLIIEICNISTVQCTYITWI